MRLCYGALLWRPGQPLLSGTGGAVNRYILFGWWWPSSSEKELLVGFWVLDVSVDTNPWET